MTNFKITTEDDMFFGACPNEFAKARRLRRRQTKSENILWERLRNKKTGLKFRRQHPINQYIADFYCHEKKLVIEIDGPYHLRAEQKEKDEIRENDLKKLGLKVIRFTDDQVFEDIEKVIKEIVNTN